MTCINSSSQKLHHKMMQDEGQPVNIRNTGHQKGQVERQEMQAANKFQLFLIQLVPDTSAACCYVSVSRDNQQHIELSWRCHRKLCKWPSSKPGCLHIKLGSQRWEGESKLAVHSYSTKRQVKCCLIQHYNSHPGPSQPVGIKVKAKKIW